MSLFQCEYCGCVENTALSFQGYQGCEDWFNWEGIEDRKGMKLCSACGPDQKWHNEFERIFLPKNEFKTNDDGNLEHTKTRSTDFRRFVL